MSVSLVVCFSLYGGTLSYAPAFCLKKEHHEITTENKETPCTWECADCKIGIR